MCGKLLVAVLPALVEGLERHGEMRLDARLRYALTTMSAATIDRQLRSWRKHLGRQPRRPATPATGLKAQIPIRTWGEWTDVEPGSMQADLVLHCGESVEGFFLTTLTLVDVATGWTEVEPIFGIVMNRVGGGVEEASRRLPVPLRELPNRCRCRLGQGHMVLQQMGGKQQFDVAGGHGFGRLDHAQGLKQLGVGTDGKAQTEAR